MARPRVRLNRAGVRALLNDDGVRADLTRRMGDVEAAAKASAPVESGGYRDSIHIEQATTGRAVVRVVADVPYALTVEAATGNLSRALDGAGATGSEDDLVDYVTKSGRKRKATRRQVANWTRGSR